MTKDLAPREVFPRLSDSRLTTPVFCDNFRKNPCYFPPNSVVSFHRGEAVPGVGFSGGFWNLPQKARKQEKGKRKQETGNSVAADWRKGDTVRNREWLTGWKSTTPEDPTMKRAGADKFAPFFCCFFATIKWNYLASLIMAFFITSMDARKSSMSMYSSAWCASSGRPLGKGAKATTLGRAFA